LNQENRSDHHVHLEKNTRQHKQSTRQYRKEQHLDNEFVSQPRLFLIATVTIVSALDVEGDEGINSLDTSRLTIFNGSNCLNCGIIGSLLNFFPPNSSSGVSSNLIVFIIVLVVAV
jgi:hypothetical protein